MRAAVIDFGGFLGVGSRKIVVDWNALHFGGVANKSDSITLELTKEQVKAAPEYKEDTPIVVLGAAGSLQPCEFDPLTGRAIWSAGCPRPSIGLTTTAASDRPAPAMLRPRLGAAPAEPDGRRPRAQSQRGLDWFIFFLADVQTGFGPFVAVYLTTQKWTQVEIGFVLSIGGIVGLLGQMPGGAIVDAARSERLVAGLAVATIGMQRACLCGVADLSGRGGRGDAACGWRAACSARRSPRSASAWSDRSRSASGSDAMPALPRSATASAAARDGRRRLSAVEPFGVSRHLHSGDSDIAGAVAHPRAGDRRRARRTAR